MAQMTRAEIRLAQQRINRMGLKDERGRPIMLRVDGIVGPKTMAAMTLSAQQPHASMPLPRPKPVAPVAGAGMAEGMSPGAINDSARALMAGPTPGAPPFMPAGPPGGMGMGGAQSMGPPRFGGVPMRDPDSDLGVDPARYDPREVDMQWAFNDAYHAGPQSPRGMDQRAMRSPGGATGMPDMVRSVRDRLFGPPPVPEAAMEAGGVVPGAPRPAPAIGDSRFGDAFAAAPVAPPHPAPEMGLLDKIRSALGVPVPAGAQPAEPQGDLANPRVGDHVLLRGKPYQFDGTQWRASQ